MFSSNNNNKVGIMSRPTFDQLIEEDFDTGVKSKNRTESKEKQRTEKQRRLREIIEKYTSIKLYDEDNHTPDEKFIPIFYDENPDDPYLVDDDNLLLDRGTELSDKYMNDLIKNANKHKGTLNQNIDIQPSINEFKELQELLQNIYGVDDVQNGGKIKRRTFRKNKNKNHRKMNKKSRKARRSRNKRR
jgi:hypothetical protein